MKNRCLTCFWPLQVIETWAEKQPSKEALVDSDDRMGLRLQTVSTGAVSCPRKPGIINLIASDHLLIMLAADKSLVKMS